MMSEAELCESRGMGNCIERGARKRNAGVPQHAMPSENACGSGAFAAAFPFLTAEIGAAQATAPKLRPHPAAAAHPGKPIPSRNPARH